MDFFIPIALAAGGALLLGWEPLGQLLQGWRVPQPPEPPPVEPDEHDIKLALISMAMDLREHLKDSSECIKQIDTCIIPSILGAKHEH